MGVGHRFSGLPGWLKVYLVGRFVNAAGALAWFYLTLYLVSDRGLDPARAGLVTAVFGAGLLAGNLGGGWLGDLIGLRRGTLVSLIGWAALSAVMPFTPTVLLAVVGGLAGVCSGAVRPLDMALIATTLPAERRRAGIALARSVTNAGFVLGPPLGALLFAVDFNLVFYADAATSLVLAGLVWIKVPATARPAGKRVAGVAGLWRELARRPQVVVLLLAVLVVDTVFRQLFTILPLMLRDLGAPTVTYGLLIALNGAVIVLCEPPIAVLLGRFAAVAVIATGFVLVATGFAALAAWPVVAGTVLAMLVITAGEMLYKPTATAHVVDAAPDRMAGRFASLYAAASTAGTAFGPALGGTLYQHLPNLLWTFAALAAFASAAGLWLLSRPRLAKTYSVPK
jgi:predicted MFS family arabinose efflux permease